MTNLDQLEEEKQEREALAAQRKTAVSILSEVYAEPQEGEAGADRLFTREEVQQAISEKIAQEQAAIEAREVRVQCREFLLSYGYDVDPHVSVEIDQILDLFKPVSLEDLKERVQLAQSMGALDGPHTITHGPDAQTIAMQEYDKARQGILSNKSLRKIFGI